MLFTIILWATKWLPWIVMMSEGRNRQIRRTFAALGYTVTKLHRTDFGNYTLNGIKRGEFAEKPLTT